MVRTTVQASERFVEQAASRSSRCTTPRSPLWKPLDQAATAIRNSLHVDQLPFRLALDRADCRDGGTGPYKLAALAAFRSGRSFDRFEIVDDPTRFVLDANGRFVFANRDFGFGGEHRDLTTDQKGNWSSSMGLATSSMRAPMSSMSTASTATFYRRSLSPGRLKTNSGCRGHGPKKWSARPGRSADKQGPCGR